MVKAMNKKDLERNELEKRARLSIEEKIPMPCGQGCPMVCCDPVIVGSLVHKSIFQRKDNYQEGIKKIQENINEILDIKTMDGRECFTFEGSILEELKGEYVGMDDSEIKESIFKMTGNNISKNKLEELVNKSKEHLRKSQIIFILSFSCSHYDSEKFSCTVHEERPVLCRDFSCEQLEQKTLKNSKKDLMIHLKEKKDQRSYLRKNRNKDLLFQIKGYFEK